MTDESETVRLGVVPVSVLAPPAAGSPPHAARPVVGGRYALAEKLGEGGMGEVWAAEQLEPVRRRVAVKLIRAGHDSAAVVRRFDAERQALALMDHPHIARIFDGGTTERGQPYFVMELIAGVPLTRYCDDVRMSIRERLALFAAVCDAVQHAHHKGIIHRDLKPGNVLVAEADGQPAPKVIDFGVAKATGGQLGDGTLSEAGLVIGTPVYMAPEQADPYAADIDTRADIYALGVILYELLVGSPPISPDEFRRGSALDMIRLVREGDTPRPSIKLSLSPDAAAVAANRGTGVACLADAVRGELECITLKAIDKERDRRYDSASALAADVRRHLAGEPVLAHPPSRSYRLRKFARRNKGPVLAAGLVAAALMAGFVGTALGLIEARQQAGVARGEAAAKELALSAEAERAEGERRAKLIAEREKAHAEARLAQVEKGAALLRSVFTDLNVAQVRESGEPVEAALAERLVKAGSQLEGDSLGDPLTVAM